jgi:AsnC-type helix-turn-helix domain
VIVIVLSCRVGHLVAGRLLFAGPAISTLAETHEAAVHRMWRSGESCLDGRAPFRRIAEALGVSEQTVARRNRGCWLGVQVQPDERLSAT